MERSKPSKGTVIRTMALLLALANQTLVLFGHKAFPVTDSELYELVSWLFTVGASLATWWKNQSFTDAAITADGMLEIIRNETKTHEE